MNYVFQCNDAAHTIANMGPQISHFFEEKEKKGILFGRGEESQTFISIDKLLLFVLFLKVVWEGLD